MKRESGVISEAMSKTHVINRNEKVKSAKIPEQAC